MFEALKRVDDPELGMDIVDLPRRRRGGRDERSKIYELSQARERIAKLVKKESKGRFKRPPRRIERTWARS